MIREIIYNIPHHCWDSTLVQPFLLHFLKTGAKQLPVTGPLLPAQGRNANLFHIFFKLDRWMTLLERTQKGRTASQSDDWRWHVFSELSLLKELEGFYGTEAFLRSRFLGRTSKKIWDRSRTGVHRCKHRHPACTGKRKSTGVAWIRSQATERIT